MSPSRRGDPGVPRTAEERERDRLERERRRARQRGGAAPGENAGSGFEPGHLSYESPPPDDGWSASPPPAHPAAEASSLPADLPPAYPDLPAAPPADDTAAHRHAEAGRDQAFVHSEQPGDPGYPHEAEPAGYPLAPEPPGYPEEPEPAGYTLAPEPPGYPQEPGSADRSGAAPPAPPDWRSTRPRPRRPPPSAGGEPPGRAAGSRALGSRATGGGAPGGGVPAVLARASAVVSGAAAAASSASAAALARARRQLARGRPPVGTGSGGRVEPDADSLGGQLRPRSVRRTPGLGAARPRPRVRPGTTTSRTTTSVSKTKRSPSVPAAPRSRRGRIAAVVALVGVVFALWFLFSLFQPLKGGGHGTVGIDVPRGASSSTIATLLADRGVISSGFFFKLRATLSGKRSQLESGHFDLRRDMSYGAALAALTGHPGQARQISVTIPEGLSRTEIAVVARREGVSGDYARASIHSHVLRPSTYGARSAHSLEGFLFPSTYDLLPGDRASKLVNAQLMAFKANLARVDLGAARAKHLSTYEVLTVASMIEREAQLPSERPVIAAVIYNRLHQGIPLGIDATIRYAINDYLRPLTASDLRLASPYNTRTRRGLPPTPIGNPGLASIEAAAHPASVAYVYYVVKPGTCGQHAFSTTFSQFQQDVARYNSARAAKGGKSPTSCAR